MPTNDFIFVHICMWKEVNLYHIFTAEAITLSLFNTWKKRISIPYKTKFSYYYFIMSDALCN